MMQPYLYMIMSGLFLTAGDIAMKKWAVGKETFYYVIGLGVYFIGLNFLAQTYVFRNLVVATTAVNILNVAILFAVSWVFFNDKLSVQQTIGLLLGIAAIVLLRA